MAETLEVLEDWEDWDPDSGLSFFTHAFAGSLAGAAEHCVMFPIDTVKTHMQASHGKDAAALNPISTFKNLMRSETHGFFRLWRGVSTMLFSCIPAHAAYFSIFEQCKVSFGADGAELTPVASAMSGIIGTIAHDGIMTPMDVIKQRLQLGFYSGALDCFKSVARNEGVKALYLSFPTTLAMNIPYAAVMVGTNESVKKIINPEGRYDIGAFITSGALAGAVAATVTNPMDVVKTRLQTQNLLDNYSHCENLSTANRPTENIPRGFKVREYRGTSLIGPFSTGYGVRYTYTARDTLKQDSCICKGASENSRAYSGFMEAVKKIYMEEGLRGFSRGVYSRVLFHAPSVAISWTTYETAKKLLS